MTTLCPTCFGNKSLQKRLEEIRPKFIYEKCSFHPRLKGIPLDEVTQIIDSVMRSNFVIGDYSSAPRMEDERVDHIQSGDSLRDIIYEITEANNDGAVTAIIDNLINNDPHWPPDGEEPFYANDQNYITFRNDDLGHSELWQNFCNSIVHYQRFFNADGKAVVSKIFEKIHLQKAINSENPIYKINPGDENSNFYRARIADEKSRMEIRKDPINGLGPPPKRLRRAGRLNSAGIATFYAAFDVETCVAELRPSVGSRIIAGEFELSRPIVVLDTTRFDGPGKELDLFAKDHMRRVAQWLFMKSFMHEIAKPILPSDEHIDYIPTQAVAEFLAHHYLFYLNKHEANIEAIIYKSAQQPEGKNIALIGDAAHLVLDAPQIAERPTSSPSSFFKEEYKDDFDLTIHKKPALKLSDTTIKTYEIVGSNFNIENTYEGEETEF